MTDLDKAIAAAREAQARADSLYENEYREAMEDCYHTQRDLLTAIDAAREQAVAWVNAESLERVTDREYVGVVLSRYQYPGDVAVFAAPPAAAVSAHDSMIDWLERGQYDVTFDGETTHSLTIRASWYGTNKPPRIIFECGAAMLAAAMLAAAERKGVK